MTNAGTREAGDDERDALLTARYALVPPVTVAPLGSAGVNNAVWSVRTGAGEFVWKELAHASSGALALEYEHWLLAELARQDLPFALPVPVRSLDGATFLHLPGGGVGLLAPRLPGEQLSRHDLGETAAFGEATGALLTALARVSPRPHPTLTPYGDLRRTHPRLPEPAALTPAALGLPETAEHLDLFNWWRELVAATAAFVAGPYRALPWQLTHADLAPGNALAVAGRVTALLDFEFAQPDARAIDLAAVLTHVLRLWERDTAEALDAAAAFCRGFGRTGALTETEIVALPDLLLLRNAVITIWWLGRDLDAEHPLDLSRLEGVRTLATWLQAHGDDLRDTIRRALAEG